MTYYAILLLNSPIVFSLIIHMAIHIKRILKLISVIVAAFLIFSIVLSYIYYLDLKKTLVAKISDKSTSFIGQKVEIGDLSFSPSAGINLYNITVKNPEGFTSGELLKIEKVFLKMKYSELFRGRFHFKDITVYSPELTVARDEKGRLNLSEKLMQFFKRKPTIRYQIDDFTIKSGLFDFKKVETNISDRVIQENKDNPPLPPFAKGGMGGLSGEIVRNENINIQLKDLSSEPGMKTLIKGNTSYTGGSKINIDGWAYPKDEPKRFNISVSSRDFALSSLKGIFEKYGIDTEKTKVAFTLNTDGDTEKGFHLKSEIKIKNAEFSFFRKDIKEILLNTNAFLDIQDNSLSIENISLQASGVTAATVKGEMKKIQKDFFYTAVLKISSLDLSVFNFMKDVKVSGIITSDNLRIQGSLKKSLPDISGIIQLRDAAFRSNNIDIAGINAQVEFLSERGMTVKAEATAKVSKAYGYLLDRPADANFALNARGSPDNMAVTSSINISPIGMHMKEDKAVYVNSVAFAVDSTIRGKTFAGKSLIEMKGVKVADYTFPWIRSSSTVTYRSNSFTATGSAIEGEGFKVSAGRTTIRLPGKKAGDKMVVEIKEVDASYPERDAGIRKAAFSLRVTKGKKLYSGDFVFSIGEAMFSGLHTGVIKGSGRFNDKEFSIDIPNAQIPRGSVKLSAKGRVSEGPFPMKITLTAENIEIGNLSKAVSKISGIPYVISGNLKIASFEGSIDSAESVQGSAGIQAEKVSLLSKDNRNILKEASLKSEIDFRREDLVFRFHAGAGKISTDISGTAKRFMKKDRLIEAQIKLPEIQLTDIRDAFWDIFPDSMLCAGLNGSVASDISIQYGTDTMSVSGNLICKALVLQGENGEYSVGPVNGTLPIAYSKSGEKKKVLDLPSFERPEFDNLRKYYSQITPGKDFTRITIGSVNYGFKLLENINVWIKQEGSILNIGRFSGKIFNGRLNGSAVVDMSEGLHYRAGVILEDLSLTKLCEGIEPIKGYISGKVNGIANLKGSGAGIPQLIGKADFWTYSAADEKTKISREFLQKIGGPSLKAYLGDRKFNKGIMSLYLQNGFVIFKELEISNRNLLGMKDLSVKVVPLNNRIAIDHLMWSIIEASQRAKKDK